jgi:hypothetical protein
MTTVTPARIPTPSLLLCGIVAGPLYVAVSLAQALTRDGFDLSRHPWSLLANGALGWIQIANFLVSGLLVLAFAVGLRRALAGAGEATAAAVLIGIYGLSLIAAGLFRADPAMGFPVGAAETPTSISWHGMLHFVAGAIGVLCLAAGCFVLGRRYAVAGHRIWALYSHATGIVFLAGFAMVATGGGSAIATLAFTAGVLCVWTWMTSVARQRLRDLAVG